MTGLVGAQLGCRVLEGGSGHVWHDRHDACGSILVWALEWDFSSVGYVGQGWFSMPARTMAASAFSMELFLVDLVNVPCIHTWCFGQFFGGGVALGMVCVLVSWDWVHVVVGMACCVR
mmetsp:Transcript_33305/g.81798  ORF Transcript_33305/g.81798 Transcript_33305/m.81798 type:complete len:118 (+) Transcript_33305:2436-2789(+)